MSLAGSISKDSLLGKFITGGCIISTLLVVLGSLPPILRIKASKATKGYPGLPYYSSLVCSTLWFTYGLLINDKTIIIANAFGVFMALFYCFVYGFYSFNHERVKIICFITTTTILLGIIAVLWYFKLVEEIRLAAMISYFIFLLSPLTVILTVLKTGDASILPIELPCALLFSAAVYIVYAYMVINNFSILLTSLCSSITSLLQLFCHLFIKCCPHCWKKQSEDSVPTDEIKKKLRWNIV